MDSPPSAADIRAVLGRPPREPPRAQGCGNCGEPMSVLLLRGHYGRPVEVDCCAPCHLLWFDSMESVRLTGASMLDLISAMANSQGEPHHTLSDRVRCPRCDGGLKLVHNQTRWGPTRQLECLQGHGMWQTFAQFLSEKGLLRALTAMDRQILERQGKALHCLNCGAALPGTAENAKSTDCAYCGSKPALLDMARLARAVDPEGATALDPEHRAAHQAAQQHKVFGCHACGAALMDESALSCAQCGATQVGTGLRQAHDLLSGMAPALRRHEAQPAPHVRQRRLDALRQDTARRREWVRDLEMHTRGRDHREAASSGHWLASLLGDRFDSDTTRQWESVLAWLLFGALIAWWLGFFG